LKPFQIVLGAGLSMENALFRLSSGDGFWKEWQILGGPFAILKESGKIGCAAFSHSPTGGGRAWFFRAALCNPVAESEEEGRLDSSG
jgi:hypothetical protein